MRALENAAQDIPTDVEMGTELPPWPSVRLEPDVPVRAILDHVLSQHFAAVYGDWADELLHFCRLTDVEAVVDR